MSAKSYVLISSDSEGWTGEAMHEDPEIEAHAIHDAPCWASATVYRVPAYMLVGGWEGMHRSQILCDVDDDCATLSEYEVGTWSGHVNEPEPACPSETGRHDWIATHEVEGGLRGNPGVFGHGGGLDIHDHCSRCDATRHIDTWATDPGDGSQGHTVVEYGTRVAEEATD